MLSSSIATLWQLSIAYYMAKQLVVIFSDSDETSFSAVILNFFQIMYQSISFLFLQTYLFINSISLYFDLLEPFTASNNLLPSHLVSEFLFLVLFPMLRMLVTMNKTKFPLRKTLKIFGKIPALG